MPGLETAIIVSIVATAISVGLGIVQMLITPKPKPAKDPSLDGTGLSQTTRQAIGYHRVIYGETRVGLHPIYLGATEANDKLHLVGAAAAHEVEALGTMFINDVPTYDEYLDGNGDVTSGKFFSSSQGAFLRVQKKLGTADQTAFAQLVADSPNGEWTADHRCRGRALLYCRFKYKVEQYNGGIPNISLLVRGKKVYDPRDASTRYQPNPALCIRDFLTSTAYGPGVPTDEIDDASFIAAANVCDEFVAVPTTGDAAAMHTVLQAAPDTDVFVLDGDALKFQRGDRIEIASDGSLPTGLSAATAYYAIPYRERAWKVGDGTLRPDDRFVAMLFASSYVNALAGVAVPFSSAGSGTITITKAGEPRYTCNGTFATDQSPRRILEDLVTSCGGRLVYSGGQFRLLGLAWTAPALVLDEDDLRGAMKVQTKRPRRDRFNAIKGTYRSPLSDWEPTDWPPILAATYETQDGGTRIFNEFDQPYTSRSGQAQRLGKIELVRNRFERVVQYPAKLSGYDCQAGDVIAITNSRWGWVEKPFEVLDRKPVMVQGEGDAPYLGIDLVLNETDEGIFDWASSEQQGDPPVIAPTLPQWSNIGQPGAPTISEYLFEGRDGSDVKAVARVSWTASVQGGLRGYEVEYRATGDTLWQRLPMVGTDTLYADIFDVAPDQYDFQVRALTTIGSASEWAQALNQTVYGLSAAPVAITGLNGQVHGAQFRLGWHQHADADVRRGGWIEFRHSPDTAATDAANATSILPGDRVDGRNTITTLPLKAGTYFARAIDKLENAGPWAYVSTNGATNLIYASVDDITEDPTFPGVMTDVELVSGAIQLTAETMDDWADVDDVPNWDGVAVAAIGLYEFAAGLDLGSVQNVRLRSHIVATTFAQGDTIDSRDANIDTWGSFDGAGADGVADCFIEIAWTDDDPAGSPTWSEWSRLDVAEFEHRGFEARAWLVSTDTAYNIAVSELRIYVEELT